MGKEYRQELPSGAKPVQVLGFQTGGFPCNASLEWPCSVIQSDY